MEDIKITIPNGTSKRLPTKGKLCDTDILVTAEGANDRFDLGYKEGFDSGMGAGYQRGYEQGESDGYTGGYQKGVVEGEEKGLAEGYSKGMEHGTEVGEQAEYNRFWDSLQENGNRTAYNGAFGSIWNDENFKPKYDIKPQNANHIFKYSGIVDLKGDLEKAGVTLDFSGVTFGRFVQMLEASKVENVGVIDTRSGAGFTINYMFYNADKLKYIEKWILTDDGTQKFGETNTFGVCPSLEEIRLEGLLGCSLSFSSCRFLSNDSVQSIIDHLKDLTGATAQTITFHSDVKANITDEQTQEIWNKNWTIG